MNAPISLSTTKQRLREKGLIGRIAVKKPLLRPANRLKRLNFAKEHKDWTIAQWIIVLWSDEKPLLQLLATKKRRRSIAKNEMATTITGHQPYRAIVG